MRLTDLHPRFVGAGGEGIYRQTDRLCPTCNGDNASACSECHGSGKEYEPAPRREGVGVIFQCPCGNHAEEHECYVPFAEPIDGQGPFDARGWQRIGDTFETLTLTPSIKRSRERGGCGWHGFITAGKVTGQVEP